jgi:hypothetical protein
MQFELGQSCVEVPQLQFRRIDPRSLTSLGQIRHSHSQQDSNDHHHKHDLKEREPSSAFTHCRRAGL